MTKTQLKAMADRIKERRKSLCFTQEQFAELIGLSIGSYTKIENAFQKPALDTLIKIAEKLAVSLDYLVFGGDTPQIPTDNEICGAIMESADPSMLTHAREILNKIITAKKK